MTETTASPCPGCGEPMDIDHAVWLVRGKFYCTETCARKAAMNQ